MRIASAISALPTQAELLHDLERQLQSLGQTPDLILLFISSALTPQFSELVARLQSRLNPRHLLAVSAESVLGNDQEIERASAVSVLAMTVGSAVDLHPFHLAEEEWPLLLSDEGALEGRLPLQDPRAFFMVADPFTTPVVQFPDVCSRVFPGVPILGGMASGITKPGETRLAVNGEIQSAGLAGIAFSGNLEIDCVVSQGCRAIGPTYEITRGEQNIIHELDGRQALTLIDDMVNALPLHDGQLLATGGLQIGRVIDQGKGNFGKGDFVIRSLLGVRRDSGAILIGDLVHPGQIVQFHLRDPKSADEELRLLLEGETQLADPAAGALLVTCNSRGQRFFDMPHHDISVTRQILGDIPIAGFFAAGELGPIAQKNFIHAHTAALALFRQPQA